MINDKFVDKAKEGKVLAVKCKKCNNMQLATILYCLKCNSDDLEYLELEGKGKVATYTILNVVAPEGYEQYMPYAWVIFELDDASIRVSGFLEGVKEPAELPLNSKVKIIGYDERGIVLAKA
jgi:hypothetical protein